VSAAAAAVSDDRSSRTPDATPGRTLVIAAWALIMFGALVRTRQYLGARSLNYDEARVAWEIASRSLAGIFDAAGFIRVAPQGWFVLEKLSMMTLGTGELSLRLVPFIAGLVALPLFWIVPRRYAGDRIALVCVALGAISPYTVYYASVLKQYSSDVMWCLLLLLAVHPLLNGTATRRSWLLAGILGVLAFWFSHPALFVLSSAGIVLLIHVLRTRRADLTRVIALGVAWAASLALNYLIVLRAQTGRETLISYWRSGFPPRNDIPFAQLNWLLGRLSEYVHNPAGFQSLALVAFAVVVGFLALLRRNLALAAILALTILFTLLASVLRLYPFDERLVLFSVPLLLMVVATAIDQLNQVGSFRLLRPGILLLALLAASPLLHAVRTLARPEGEEEIKAVLNYAADRMNADDVMYLGSGAYGAYTWYSTFTHALRNPRDRTIQGPDVGRITADSMRAQVEQLRRYRRVWLVFVDFGQGDVDGVTRHLEPIAVRRDEFRAPGAATWLYEFRSPPDSAGAGR
jgi:hypothetical protein